ncbi:MAG: RraA family protein [Alphaproteobacteria bacterium]|nr:RraA family protein [Alphaproteobacteria bacterium]
MTTLGEPMNLELFDELRRISTATIFEAYPGLPVMAPAIKQMVAGTSFAGPALTAKCLPGDNTAVTRAVDRAQRGEVIVIDADNAGLVAVWGENATYFCQLKGVAGCVTNGAVRDIDYIREQNFPIFATGVSVRGSIKHRSGWLDVPIAIGEAVVHPGDVVVGDGDGVIVIPKNALDQVIVAARRRRADEDSRNARLRAGASMAEIMGAPKG